MQDEIIDLDAVTADEHDSLFDLKQQPARSYEKDSDTVMNINVEMSLDKVDIERENYSFIDVLSDAGGI